MQTQRAELVENNNPHQLKGETITLPTRKGDVFGKRINK